MMTAELIRFAALCGLALASPVAGAADLPPIKTVSHVHSAYSGRDAPDLRATLEMAHRRGIEAVILADDAIASFKYGLWPLQDLLRLNITRNSVLKVGPDLYLEHIAALRASFPDLIIIPGVEAAAFYFWSGDPLRGLTINDWNRHLSVAGMERAQDYEDLPVLGNRRRDVFQPRALWPLLLLILAGMLLLARRRRAAVLPALVGALFFANNFPFKQPPFDPYDSTAGWKPYQALALYAQEKGALCFWNHPEAPNWLTMRKLGWHVAARTAPYPECLHTVPQTDGFAALLEGDRAMTKPGREWDRALLDYVQGRRTDPSWGFGELDYVGEGRGPGMGSVYMDVHAAARTAPALLRALKAGRFEAIAAEGSRAVSLQEWRIVSQNSSAASGETLRNAVQPSVRIALTPKGAPGLPATVTLIRNGLVIFSASVDLPFTRSITDDPGGDKRLFYRLDVRFGANGALLSNPIFVFND